jgi:WD40 repeat protein
MAKVFISYSRKDIEFAKKLTGELQKSDMDFWVDWEGIPPTVDWWREIEKGIEEADAFIFLISPDSAKSKVCGQEIEAAVQNGKRMIPIVVRDIAWEDTPPHLGHLNYIFFRETDDFDASVKKLLNAIHTDYEWVQAHRRLQVKALEWERHNKENSFLLRGQDLQTAESNLALNTSKVPHPTDLMREYVFASRKAADRQRRILTGVSLAGVVIMAMLAIFGLFQANQASDNAAVAQANLLVAQTAQADAQANLVVAQAAQAEAQANLSLAEDAQAEAQQQAQISRAGELAALGLSQENKHFDLALLLSLEGFKELDNARTRGTLLTLTDSHPRLEYHLFGHTSWVTSVAYSPDGTYLVSSGDHYEDGLSFWDMSQPDAVPTRFLTLDGRTGTSSLVFSPNGELLVSGHYDGTIVLWDVRNPKVPVELTILSAYSGLVSSVAIDPNGKWLASSSFDDPNIMLWDISTPAQPVKLAAFSGGAGSSYMWSVQFSPRGGFLASSDGRQIELWNIANPANPLRVSSFEGGQTFTFSPDGNQIAAGFDMVNLWNVSNPSVPTKLETSFSASTATLMRVMFSSDGNQIAAGYRDGSIYLWNVYDYDRRPIPLAGHKQGVTTLAFAPSGSDRLVSGGYDGIIIGWDTSRDVLADSQLARLQGDANITSVAFSPDAAYVATSDYNNQIILWDVSNPVDATRLATLSGYTDRVWSVAFHPDANRKMLASGGLDNTVRLWDIGNPANPSQLFTLIGHTNGGVLSVEFSPSGNILASGGSYGEVILWDTSQPDAAPQLATLPGEALIFGLAFSPDGNTLAVGDWNGQVVLWNISDPRTPVHITDLSGHGAGVTSVAFSPDGKLLASGREDSNIILWDVSNLASSQQLATLFGHNEQVADLMFRSTSEGDTYLISGSWDKTVILWDVSQPRTPSQLSVLSGHIHGIEDLALSPDGQQLASGSDDWTVVLWDINPATWLEKACSRAGRNLSGLEWAQYFPNDEHRKTCEQWPLLP